MHELGIAENILDIVRQSVPGPQLRDVRTVRLRVGPFAGVVVDSLEFCFTAMVADTALAQTRLHIDETSLSALCRDCHSESAVKEFAFRCPACGSVNLEIVSGQELEITEIELVDGPEERPGAGVPEEQTAEPNH